MKKQNLSSGIFSCLNQEVVAALVRIVIDLPGNPAGERKGGFFSTYDSRSQTMTITRFGIIPEDQISQYLRNATEKVTRLVQNPGHHRSFQSRDEEKQYWGGGIRYLYLYCAFSGFSEKLEEAISLIHAIYVAHRGVDDDRDDFKEAVLSQQKLDYSDNEFIEKVMEAFILLPEFWD